ncbi:M23 family metallopeptidase [Campylobacter gastrosuis]|uniref:M23 family metallopeptidase n=1 Tax=Campylobacter gastrosuis TaxID=2974576 RepID=A0ABT7HLX8_9BACT|nr:M23 family metallopeptidase [Campylobacter gastrosuis]MDL0087961.1 M23 family metallopeptidase [Campylobacter gastrosuis]
MRRRGLSIKSIVLFLIFFIVLTMIWTIFTSKDFEKNAPEILIKDKIYWNLKTPLNIKFKDDTGVKFVRINMSDGQNSVNVLNQTLDTPLANFDINLTIPKTSFFSVKESYTINIEATDASRWNFFSGNTTKKDIQVVLDTTKPDLYILSNSYSISKGGSAIVVFKATDNDIKDVYVRTNYGKNFKATPFYKDGFYASLVVWPVSVENFSADVVAVDNAGNESRMHVRYFNENVKYKVSTIALKDGFIDGKIAELTEKYAKDPNSLSRLEKMKFINETLRDENDKKLSEISSFISTDRLEKFAPNVFYPLKNGKKVADFADHRYYTYNGEQVSESWHMGLDLASVAAAPIITSNDGVVAFVGDNGIYGLNVVIDHGFGFYSLYAHCSSVNVKQGDAIKAGSVIANTGVSGLALGDHLHFGILIHGEEVRPQQWLDKKWIKDNITGVLNAAKEMIDKN